MRCRFDIDLMVPMNIEVVWHGRGGQGVVTANEILAEAAISAGKYVKAFPEFGPERMGAPIKGFTRISEKPIRVHSPVYEPDVVIVLDGTLIGKVNVAAGIKEDGIILANFEGTPEELQKAIGTKAKCHTVNATKISIEEIGRPMANTAMLGALAKVKPIVEFDLISEHVVSKLGDRLSEKVIDSNLSALKRAFEEVQ